MEDMSGAGPAVADSASEELRPSDARVLHGDCRVLFADMEEHSVDAIVTDPPYGLEFMGRDWDAPWKQTAGGFSAPGIGERRTAWPSYLGSNRSRCGNCKKLIGQGGSPCRCESPQPVLQDADRMRLFQEWSHSWATEALRVLKPGGHLVAFSGARTYHRMACAIEDAGFEIRDQIMWIYGSGFPKGGNRGGKGTCLKPAHEPIVFARKPLIGSVAANEARFGTGAINIDACRVGSDQRTNPAASASSLQRASRAALGYRSDAGVGPGAPANTVMGRWPANIVHDGSDDVLAAFPDAPGQLADASLSPDRRKSQNVYGDMRAGRAEEPSAGSPNAGAVGFQMKPGARRLDGGSAARFFYCAKASKADRDDGLDAFEPQAFVQFQTGNGESGGASSLSEGRETQYRNTHPTVKPTDLMRWLVRLVTPPGGLVLDPFTGSGSTGKAAVLEGLSFLGFEMTEQYVPIARARIAAAERRRDETRARVEAQGSLFGAAA